MASKNLSVLSIIFQNLFLLMVILSFIPKIKTLSFEYPTAFTLTNGEIFVIHKFGIDICNPQFTSSTRKLTFSPQLTETDLSKISISKFSSGEYLIFIIKRFYIFDENGNKKIQTDSLSSISGGEYFTIAAHKMIKSGSISTYYFLFGYIDVRTDFVLRLYYLKADTSTSAISTIYSKTINKVIAYNGLSCEFLVYGSSDYFMCIYEEDYYSEYEYLEIAIIKSNGLDIYDYIDFVVPEIEYSKSTLKSKDSRAFFCGLDKNGGSFCFIYNINDFNNLNENGKHFISRDLGNSEKCITKPYNIKPYYFPQTEEFVFSCLTEDNGIQTSI